VCKFGDEFSLDKRRVTRRLILFITWQKCVVGV
jgi:hypothetical protein